MVRRPCVAGMFYDNGYSQLSKQITQAFLHKKGPGTLPSNINSPIIKAIIVPHAGYIYSGPCAAWAYKDLAEIKKPETVLILGLNHRERISAFSDEPWETPLGTIQTDSELVNTLSKKTGIKIQNSAHRYEHSIEVQIPFIQYIYRESIENLKIIPLMLAEDINYYNVGIELRNELAKIKKTIVMVCSSDFTHYGPNYNYTPFQQDIKKHLYELDLKAIEIIKQRNSREFLEYIEKTQTTICGRIPIAVTLEYLGNGKGELLSYYTSADITGGYENAVGYASIKF